jgi:hypothetical protein
MTDQTTDDQQNTVTTHWYDDFAGDDEGRQEQLGKFESFDDFFEDYNNSKNFDWRTGVAGDDDKFKSTLERYDSLQSFGNSFREAQQKIRSGQLQPTLADDASEDEIKAFREANNIPTEVSGYLENLPDGMVVGEDDAEIMSDLFGALHNVQAPPPVAHAIIGWYNDFAEKQQDAIAELDTEQTREATDFLRDAENGWGKDFRTNMNLVNSVLENYFGEEAKNQLINGRYQDGRGFFNDPGVLMGIAKMAREINDVAPLIAQDPNQMQSLHEEISELEKKMADRTSDYWKGPSANENQARYRELLELRLRSEKGKDAA